MKIERIQKIGFMQITCFQKTIMPMKFLLFQSILKNKQFAVWKSITGLEINIL